MKIIKAIKIMNKMEALIKYLPNGLNHKKVFIVPLHPMR
jgi:hypothetical protein